MSNLSLEKRRIRASTGFLPSNPLSELSATHPFIQQIDVVYPSNKILDGVLTDLKTRYARGTMRIADVQLNEGGKFSDLLILTPKPDPSSDVWCLDPRGAVTLSVCKETYEEAGLPGHSLPFKGHMDRHVIQFPLAKVDADSRTSTETGQAKQKTNVLVKGWEDRRKERDGLDGWNVVYCSLREPERDPEVILPSAEVRQVTCTQTELKDVHIPANPALLSPRPSSAQGKRRRTTTSGAISADAEALEDWNEGVMELIEWVGMVMLGSQRLQANDQVDPYVAVYDAPQPSRVGDVTHMSWRGLLSPLFVQSIIDAVCSTLDNDAGSGLLASITLHGAPTSPIGFLPSPKPHSEEGDASDSTRKSPFDDSGPARLPREDGEDTVTLVVGRDNSSVDPKQLPWLLVESIGQWDTRWG